MGNPGPVVKQSAFNPATFSSLSDVYKCAGVLQLPVEGWDRQSAGWKSPHSSLVLSAIDLATFCAICTIEWPYMTPFGMVLFTASLLPATSWLPTAPDQPPLYKHLWYCLRLK